MNRTLIKNATIINEGRTFTGSVLIEDDKIAAVYEGTIPAVSSLTCTTRPTIQVNTCFRVLSTIRCISVNRD